MICLGELDNEIEGGPRCWMDTGTAGEKMNKWFTFLPPLGIRLCGGSSGPHFESHIYTLK